MSRPRASDSELVARLASAPHSLVAATYMTHVRHHQGAMHQEQRDHAAALVQPRPGAEQSLVGLLASWISLAQQCEVEAGTSLAALSGEYAMAALQVLQGAYALSYTAPQVGRLLREPFRELLDAVASAAGYPPHWRKLDCRESKW